MDHYLPVRFGLALSGFLFISYSIRNREIYIEFQVWLLRSGWLLNQNWYLPIGYWFSMWSNPIDDCMETTNWDCLWILPSFLCYLFGQVLIWLCTIMVINLVLAFCFRSDEDHLGTTYGSICEEFRGFLLQVIASRFLKAK